MKSVDTEDSSWSSPSSRAMLALLCEEEDLNRASNYNPTFSPYAHTEKAKSIQFTQNALFLLCDTN